MLVFFLNNEMDDFAIKPDHANQFGLLGNAQNAVAPQKRMLSSMTPTIVTKDGDLRLVVGYAGGCHDYYNGFPDDYECRRFWDDGTTKRECAKSA